jgi:hypothetical protein
LKASAEDSVRYLWVDDIFPPEALQRGQTTATTTAWIGGGGRKQRKTLVVLLLDERAIAAIQADDWLTVLPSSDHFEWMRFSRTNNFLVIDLRRDRRTAAS